MSIFLSNTVNVKISHNFKNILGSIYSSNICKTDRVIFFFPISRSACLAPLVDISRFSMIAFREFH